MRTCMSCGVRCFPPDTLKLASMAAARECSAAAVEALETNDAAALVSAFRGAAASAVNEKVVGGKLADTAICPPLECEDGDTLLHL